MELSESEQRELQKGNLGELGPRRKRTAKTVAVSLLLLILLLLPTRVEKIVWYAQNVSCLLCHPEMISAFDKRNVHEPFRTKRCLSCHSRHATAGVRERANVNRSIWGELIDGLIPRFIREDVWNFLFPPTQIRVAGIKSLSRGIEGKYLVESEGVLCLSCHRRQAAQMSNANPHPPFNDQRCIGCHDPHASDFASLTRIRSDELCSVCHRMTEDAISPVVHGPFKIRSCTSCHTGHASNISGLLKAGQKDVCFTCHRSIAQQLYLPVRHRPFESGRCTDCHKPHASEAKFLLTEDMPGECYRCHGNVKRQFELSSKHPISASFTCVRCHDPHAQRYPVLLPASGNGVCYRCHGDIVPSFEAIRHSKVDFSRGLGSCLGCHLYHGSSNAPLLVDEAVSLCRRCHVGKMSKLNHPVGGSLYDPRRGSQLTCTSTCHWIHYVPQRALLKWTPDELCLVCHVGTGYWQ